MKVLNFFAGSAGLGISLKGNQSTKTGLDLGVFVRTVIRGGAAWQVGMLFVLLMNLALLYLFLRGFFFCCTRYIKTGSVAWQK